MTIKNIAKLTLEQFLEKKGIVFSQYKHLNQIHKVSYRTMMNIIYGYKKCKSDNNYRGRLPYFPTETTISKLSLELDITFEELKKLIENQHKSNKKVAKNK